MRAYKVSYSPENVADGLLQLQTNVWCGTQAEVRQAKADLKKKFGADRARLITHTEVEVPWNKADLLAWLNANLGKEVVS